MLTFESTSRRFSLLLPRDNCPPPDTTSSCSPMEFPDSGPQPTQKQQTLLPYALFTWPRGFSPSLSPAPLPIANVNIFQTTYIILPQTQGTKEARQPQASGRVCLPLHLAPLLVVWTACPRTWSFLGPPCGSISAFFQRTLQPLRYLFRVSGVRDVGSNL